MDLRVKTVEEKAHTHENEAVLVGITAEKVAAWDSAEENAKSAADTALTEATAAINETIQELTNTVNEKATSEALKTVSDKLDALAGIKTLDQELALDE
jgi:enoyl-[acyl-carrier-protein] reductase (NADH)